MKNTNIVLNGKINAGVSFEDFENVYRVFGEYPFNEYWTTEEILGEYRKYDGKDSKLFGFYTDEKCVSIIAIHPMVPGEHPITFPPDKKVMYFSDIATLRDYRNRGIGTHLMLYGLEISEVLGYDYAYLRTNFDEKESMSAGIARKCGFKRNWEVCQEIEHRRSDGTVRTDLRMFMEKKLK